MGNFRLTVAALVAALAAFLSVPASAVAPTVSVRSSQYGRILFDGRGFVLYAFTADRARRSRCTGACAKAWPPYIVKKRATGKLLGTTRRVDGSLQVTFAGRPLYYYVGDRKPGQILCQNVSEFGGLWLVVRGDGRLVR
jgi:predicted lipoprotein with Yx(FWY)xxD motif